MATIDPSTIREHMEVVAADGAVIGKVDHMQDGKIKLTKNDSPNHQHHMVPLSWVRSVESVVNLEKTLAEIKGATSGSPGVAATDAVPEPGQSDAVPKTA